MGLTGMTNPRKRLEPQTMPLDRLDAMVPREPSIAVHHESDMPWHRSLP